jgi:hypothetical protein
VLLAVLAVAVETQMVVEILAVQELLIKVILGNGGSSGGNDIHNVEVEAVVLLHLVALELMFTRWCWRKWSCSINNWFFSKLCWRWRW